MGEYIFVFRKVFGLLSLVSRLLSAVVVMMELWSYLLFLESGGDMYLPSRENSLSVRRLADCLLFLEELEWKVGMFTSTCRL